MIRSRTPDTKVVFYGYGPALGYWLLKLYRHADASVLDLSKRQWHDDGRPWTTERSEPRPTRYALPEPNAEIRALQPMVAAAIGTADPTVLDVRSEAEFLGERFWPSGAPAENGRAGRVRVHIYSPPFPGIKEDQSTVYPCITKYTAEARGRWRRGGRRRPGRMR